MNEEELDQRGEPETVDVYEDQAEADWSQEQVSDALLSDKAQRMLKG